MPSKNDIFLKACKEGDLGMVDLLLNQSKLQIQTRLNSSDDSDNDLLDVNIANEDGTTPFALAIYNGNVEIVKKLLSDERIDVLKGDNEGDSPFTVACGIGNHEITKIFLLDSRINVNQTNNDGATPFTIACAAGKLNIVELLLNEISVDINQPTHNGRTPFIWASYHGHDDIVQLLLTEPRIDVETVDNERASALLWSCAKNRLNVVEILLADKRTKVNASSIGGDTPLTKACANGYLEIVKLLLNKLDIDVNQAKNDGVSPFLLACIKGRTQIVELLLADERIDVNKKDMHEGTAFFYTCISNQIAVLKLLLADRRFEEDMNAKDNEGWTPLAFACKKGHFEIIDCLLQDERINLLPTIVEEHRKVGFNIVLSEWALYDREDFSASVSLFLETALERNPHLFEGSSAKTFVKLFPILSSKIGLDDLFSPNLEQNVDTNHYFETLTVIRIDLIQKIDQIKKKLQKKIAAQIFGLTIFLNDNYLVFKNTIHESATEKYFRILMRLNMDLQMLVTLRTASGSGVVIPKQYREKAFHDIAGIDSQAESVNKPLLYTYILEVPQISASSQIDISETFLVEAGKGEMLSII